MSKVITRITLAASLTLSTMTGASASLVGTYLHGNGNFVRTTGLGHVAPSDFVIDSDNNTWRRSLAPARTVLRGSASAL